MTENIHIKNISGKVGSYAISTVDLSSFTSDALTRPVQKTRKTRNVKEVIHKVFTDCAAATSDPFWVEKFTNASYGKFPPKFSYNDGILTYRKGAKTRTLEIPMLPYEGAKLCMDFFRSNGSLFSELDQQYSEHLQDSRSQDVLLEKPLEWGDLNKKMQACMLSYYVVSMKEVMRLKDNEVEQLRQTLYLGTKNKLFGKDNIRVENNRIQTVDGLLWNNNDRQFFINPELKPTSTRTYTRKKNVPESATGYKDMKPQFVNKWNKYTERLCLKTEGRIRAQRRIRVLHQSTSTPRRLTLITSGNNILSPRSTGTSPSTGDDITDAEDTETIETTDD